MPFDIGHLDAAKTPAARKMIERIHSDLDKSASKARTSKAPKLQYLIDEEVDYLQRIVERGSDSSGTIDERAANMLHNALEKLGQLLLSLQQFQIEEAQRISQAVQSAEGLANFGSNLESSQDGTQLDPMLLQFLLERQAGQKVSFWFEFLVSCLLSESSHQLLCQFNPLLDEAACVQIENTISVTMLRAVKLGQLNRCIASVLQLMQLIRDLTERILLSHYAKSIADSYHLGSSASPTISMLRYALHKCNYHGLHAQELIDDLVRVQSELIIKERELSSASETSSQPRQVTSVILSLADFDSATASSLLDDRDKVRAIMDLAKRQCYYNGKKATLEDHTQSQPKV